MINSQPTRQLGQIRLIDCPRKDHGDIDALAKSIDALGLRQPIRDMTEHCVVRTKGRPLFQRNGQATELRAPRRERSRRPDALYALVASLCVAPACSELFSCAGRRRNWHCHDDQIGKFFVAGKNQFGRKRTNVRAHT
jgi:N6-adenosine-specific RNA methylase IME4